MESVQDLETLAQEFLQTPESLDDLGERGWNIQRNATTFANGKRTDHTTAPVEHPWNLSRERFFGGHTYVNTPVTLHMFTLGLGMSKHPLVDVLSQGKSSVDFESFGEYLTQLSEAQVLKGLRILELASGPRPMLARMSRALGATVYTADTLPASEFSVYEKYRDSQEAHIERKYHIQINLNDYEAPSKLIEITGGNFGYLTEASFYEIQQASRKFQELLREGGVVFEMSGKDQLSVKTARGMLTNKEFERV